MGSACLDILFTSALLLSLGFGRAGGVSTMVVLDGIIVGSTAGIITCGVGDLLWGNGTNGEFSPTGVGADVSTSMTGVGPIVVGVVSEGTTLSVVPPPRGVGEFLNILGGGGVSGLRSAGVIGVVDVLVVVPVVDVVADDVVGATSTLGGDGPPDVVGIGVVDVGLSRMGEYLVGLLSLFASAPISSFSWSVRLAFFDNLANRSSTIAFSSTRNSRFCLSVSAFPFAFIDRK